MIYRILSIDRTKFSSLRIALTASQSKIIDIRINNIPTRGFIETTFSTLTIYAKYAITTHKAIFNINA